MAQEDYWWPTMKEDIKAYVQGCLKCQATKTITRRNTPPLIPITPTHTLPFATITMDFITKLPESGGCDSILTVTDHNCTKAVILVPCKEQMTTEEFLELYREKVFPYTGLPQKVISDRDVHFTSTLFKELCKQLAIEQNMSTAYHPQTNGQSERTNQMVETILRLYCNQEQDNWREWLPVVQYIINSRPSATTKQSPYELWMGFVPRTHQPVRPSKLPHFEKRKQELLRAREVAQEAMKHAQDLLKKETRFRQYKVGDKVWLEGRNIKTTHPTTKLREKRFGPFEVTEVISKVVYRLNLPLNWKIHNVFHAALLHPCKQTEINKTRYEEPPPDVIKGQEEWEVEQIVKTRRSGRNKVLQYLVRWKGYSSAHDSWEPADQVHAPELVKAYFDKNPQAIRRVEKDKKGEEGEGARQQTPLVICRTIHTSRTNMTDIIDISPSPVSVTPEDIALRNPERPLSPTSSVSSYGLGWLFPDEELQYPQSEEGSKGSPQHEGDQPFTLTSAEEDILHSFLVYQCEELEIMLPRISEESQRILEERARELQMNWLVPGENEEVLTQPRAGTPYPRSDALPSPPTYQDRGVSPFNITEKEGESVYPDDRDLHNKLREYERELQTLHVIQNKPEVQSAVQAYLLCNPTAFQADELLILAQTELDKDPRGEIARAILAAGAMTTECAPSPLPVRSPSPLPIPPHHESTSPWHPSTPHSEVSQSPSSASSISATMEEYIDLEGVERGRAPGPDLTTGGWYPVLPGERQLHIPGPSGSWPEVQAQFLRSYIHPWSAQPTIKGAMGQNTGVYGESLFADPRPDILPSCPEGELQQYLSADNYFHGGAQRAIWQLGDYGVAADIWRLQSLPLRQKSLHEQELTVLRHHKTC
jgi:hypothetical protein